MHEDVGDVERGDGGEHVGVELAAGDVVDNVGSRFDGAGGREALAGVDRDDGLGQRGAEEGDEGRQFGGFVGGGEHGGSRPGGHDAEVEDVGSGGKEVARLLQQELGGVVAATVVEGVGGGVEYAHDGRTGEGGFTPLAAECKRGNLMQLVHVSKKNCIFAFCPEKRFCCFFIVLQQ